MQIIKMIIKKVKTPVKWLYKHLTLKVLYPRIYKKYARESVDERKIVFVETRDSYLSDNFQLIYDNLKRNYDLELHVHFLRTKSLNSKERNNRCKALMQDMATAKYIFTSDASNVLTSAPLRPETKIIQLWHACGALKKFDNSEHRNYPEHKNYSLVPVSSDEVAKVYEDAMGLTSGIVKPLGVSRTDVFYDEKFIQAAKDKLYETIPQGDNKKVILYAPTFRDQRSAPAMPNKLNIELFKEQLADEYILLLKRHPDVLDDLLIPEDCQDFAFEITNEFSIDEALCIADICISDYSSVIFEYSLFEKPMIFFAYDLEEYRKWQGFYYDYETMVPGPICKDNKSIISCIKQLDEKFDKKKVIAFRKKFIGACDGHATKRIIDAVFGTTLAKYKRETPLDKDAYLLPETEPWSWDQVLYVKIRKFIKHQIGRVKNHIFRIATLKWIYPRVYKKYSAQPIDEQKIIFIETRYPHLSDSFHLLYDRIKQNYDVKINVHFLLMNATSKSERLARCKSLIKDMATAKYVFVSDGSSALGSVQVRPETKVIQLWHACGAFKKFGKSTSDLIFGESAKHQEKYPTHKNYTLVPVSSPEVIWAYEEAMSLEKGIVQALGTSRTDVFYNDEVIRQAHDKLHKYMPESIGKKVILYAPTFRGRVAKATTSHELDISMFKEHLSNEYVLLTKHHPLVKDLPIIPRKDSGFARDVTNDFNIEELLCFADICISDYSSLIFEYSLFERPMVFFAYDIEEYNDWRGFYYNYDELTPGPIFTTNEEMIDYIKNLKNEFNQKEVVAFREKFMSACDGQATKRIMNEVFTDNLEKYKRATPISREDYEYPIAHIEEKGVK